MLSTYCVSPAGKHFGMSHGRGGWHRACSVELICASEHQRRTYREEDLNTGAWPREEIRPACPLRSRGQLRGLYRGPSSRVRFWPLGTWHPYQASHPGGRWPPYCTPRPSRQRRIWGLDAERRRGRSCGGSREQQ